jgi:hypothetical protein
VVSQVAALRETLAALDLRPEHAALVAYCEGLAEVLDEHPATPSLWREYRPALESLLALGGGGEDESQAVLLKLLTSPTAAKKAPKKRASA